MKRLTQLKVLKLKLNSVQKQMISDSTNFFTPNMYSYLQKEDAESVAVAHALSALKKLIKAAKSVKSFRKGAALDDAQIAEELIKKIEKAKESYVEK